MRRDRDSLYDILESIRLIHRYVEGHDQSHFEEDIAIQDAVARRFEIIGEATKRLSEQMRAAHPEVPWRAMAAMRNRVIHGYDTIDLDVMWKTIHEDLPRLESQIEAIFSDDGPSS